jgi:arginyl-tRNA synthetase
VAEILKANGHTVIKTNLVNDRGIHICKSMLAWQKFGNGQTPESSGLKGDKLVGNFYVKFDQEYKVQISELIAQGKSEDDAKKLAPIILEAQQMLLDWEAGKPEVIQLWKTMNQWVYNGFAQTYKNLGVDFDSYYYESNTYLLGKEVVQFGLEKGIFEKDADGSVWIDLTPNGLDRKIVLRSDGTAVYMTQDIGTAIQRVKDFQDVGGMVYTVGNEQDYHFKVLFLILKKLGFDWAESLYHLSYGMVELPSGKMKSREGTVVDADDLMEEMTETAGKIATDLGKLEGYSAEEKAILFKTIGLGALKYYILKVDPKKQILFNPEESVDFAGNTGPFIQYTYARIQSILRKADFDYQNVILSASEESLHPKEKELLKQIELYPEVIQNAANNHSPALVANYTYELVKEYNSFYQSVSILGEENRTKKVFRVQLSKKVADTIKSAFKLLGIEVPERM